MANVNNTTDISSPVRPSVEIPGQSSRQSIIRSILKWRQYRKAAPVAWKEYAKQEVEKINPKDKYYQAPIKLSLFFRILLAVGLVWEFIISGSQLVLMFMVTYGAIYTYFDKMWWRVCGILDWVYYCDVMARLAAEHWRHSKKMPILLFPVRYKWYLVIMDLLSLIPLETIYVVVTGADFKTLYTVRAVELFRLNRLLRFFRGRRIFNEMNKELRHNERLIFICRFLYDYIVYIHVLACIMYLMCEQTFVDWGLCQAQEIVDSWTQLGCWVSHRVAKRNFRLIPNPGSLYVLSVEFVTEILTTVGYGDLYPLTTREYIFGILIMIVGEIVITGDFTTHLTGFHLKHDEARFDLFFRLEAILASLKDQKCHPVQFRAIKDYYNSMWNFRHGIFEADLTNLPLSIQEDLFYDICKKMMYKLITFRGVEDVFIRAMSAACKICLLNTNTVILRPGVHTDAIYYVIHGELRVRSRFKNDHIACILRPGSIFGEFGLLLGFPSMVQIETHTACELLKLTREAILGLFEQFPHVRNIVRLRINICGANLGAHLGVMGTGAVTWTEQLNKVELNSHNSYAVFRSGKFPNFIVTKDVMDDTKDTLISEIKTNDKSIEKNYIQAYDETVVPNIYVYKQTPILVWNIFIFVYSATYCMYGPYCFAFDTPHHIRSDDYSFCQIMIDGFPVFILINFADLMAEILWAAPLTGFYYKFWNGLSISYKSIQFWLDIIACLPIDPFVSSQDAFMIRTFCKFPKIFRFLSYVDSSYPLKLAFIRLMKSVIFLGYSIHIVACIFFWVACPDGYDPDNDTCYPDTWMDSQANALNPEKAGKYIRRVYPYLISLHFATATLTSVGVGDFNPRRPIEGLWCIIFMIAGILVRGYSTAALISGLSCGVRPKLAFSKRLSTVLQFMEHHGLSEQLKRRVAEHYTLQYQLAKGVSLPPGTTNLLYDAPDFIADDALSLEVDVFLEGVPLFTKADPKLLAKVGRKLKRTLLPPQITFLFQGEVRRQMYIIVKGSVAMLGPDLVPVAVYESTAHFGIRDMLYGVPSEYSVRTLSYCLLLSLDYADFLEAVEGELDLLILIDKAKPGFVSPGDENIPHEIKKYGETVAFIQTQRSWIEAPQKPTGDKDEVGNTEFDDFEDTYRTLRFRKLFHLCLMHRTIHPAGRFAKVWTYVISIASLMTIQNLFLELLMGWRHPYFRIFQIFIDMFHWTDIFLKMHWAYYGANNILVSHPVKTAIRYIFDGTFPYDLIMICPFELIISVIEGTNILGYGPGASWFSKLRWTRFLCVYKFPELITMSRLVFKNRVTVLVTTYILVTFLFSTLLSTVAIYMSCPVFPVNWEDGNEYKIPACRHSTWTDVKDLLFNVWERWLSGIYYVLQIILTVGYGDLDTLKRQELIFLILLSFVGFLIVQATTADMTAAQVDSDEIRAVFSERRKCILKFLKVENVPQKMIRAVNRHVRHVWKKSKGLQPRSLFGDLHPVLQADLFRELAAEQLKRVKIFSKFNETVIGTICQYLRKEHYARGQRLSRAGNLEFEMFIIATGKIYMADNSNAWCCSLRKGEFFGEISMLFGTPRRHSAFAATAVEVFILGAEEFTLVLNRYPSVREDLLEALGDVRTERFEKKILRQRKKNISKYLLKSDINSDEIQDFFHLNEIILTSDRAQEDVNLSGWRKLWKKSYSWIVGTGIGEHNLPLLFFPIDPKTRVLHRLPHPNSKLILGLRILTLFVQYVSPLLAIYEVFFIRDEIPGEVVTQSVALERKISSIVSNVGHTLEFVMFIHILFQFITPFEFENEIYCYDFHRISFNYVTTIRRFWIDLISTFPYKLFIVPLSWARRLALFRLLRLIPFYSTLLVRHLDLEVSPFSYKLPLTGTVAILLVHMMSCCFYWVACPLNSRPDKCANHTWVSKMQNDAKGKIVKAWTSEVITELYDDWNILPRWYIRSAHWVFTTISSCGFGDIVPLNLQEMGLAIVTILFGVFGVSIIIGNISTGLGSSRRAKREFDYNIHILLSHMKSIGLSEDGKNLMLSHYLSTWARGRGQSHTFAMSVLPLTLRCDVATAVYSPTIRSCKFFGGIDDFPFIRNVCARLHHSQYLPGVFILNNDEVGDSLYIVFKGEVAGYLPDGKGGLIFQRTYAPGECFGKAPALFAEIHYNKYYRAEGYCEVLRLQQPDIQNLAFYFPEWRGFLTWVITHRYFYLVKQGKRHIFYVSTEGVKEQMVLEYLKILTDGSKTKADSEESTTGSDGTESESEST